VAWAGADDGDAAWSAEGVSSAGPAPFESSRELPRRVSTSIQLETCGLPAGCVALFGRAPPPAAAVSAGCGLDVGVAGATGDPITGAALGGVAARLAAGAAGGVTAPGAPSADGGASAAPVAAPIGRAGSTVVASVRTSG